MSVFNHSEESFTSNSKKIISIGNAEFLEVNMILSNSNT